MKTKNTNDRGAFGASVNLMGARVGSGLSVCGTMDGSGLRAAALDVGARVRSAKRFFMKKWEQRSDTTTDGALVLDSQCPVGGEMDQRSATDSPTSGRGRQTRIDEAEQWLNGSDLGFNFGGNEHRYSFTIHGRYLEIRESSSYNVFRSSILDLVHLEQVTISRQSAPGLKVSTLLLEGGCCSVTFLLDGRRKLEPSIEILIKEDSALIRKLARVLTHLAKIVRAKQTRGEEVETSATVKVIECSDDSENIE